MWPPRKDTEDNVDEILDILISSDSEEDILAAEELINHNIDNCENDNEGKIREPYELRARNVWGRHYYGMGTYIMMEEIDIR